MDKYLFSIGLIVAGLVVGQGIRRLAQTGRFRYPDRVGRLLRLLQQVALLGLSPLVTLGAFWGVSLRDVRYVVIPFLGVLALLIGGVLGLWVSRMLKHDPARTGAMFCASSFTNLGSFGGLISYLFFGEAGYVVVSLYRLLEEVAYFLIGFPIAKRYGMDPGGETRRSVLKLLKDPYILVYLGCITVGVALKGSGVVRPAFYPSLNAVLVPVVSGILVVTTGFNMKLGAVRAYLKECTAVALIKFVATPIVITTLAWLAGLGEADGGLALRVVFVLSAMPPAFYALIPPQIYKLDTDLANSCWLFNSGIFLVLIPLLYMGQGLL